MLDFCRETRFFPCVVNRFWSNFSTHFIKWNWCPLFCNPFPINQSSWTTNCLKIMGLGDKILWIMLKLVFKMLKLPSPTKWNVHLQVLGRKSHKKLPVSKCWSLIIFEPPAPTARQFWSGLILYSKEDKTFRP